MSLESSFKYKWIMSRTKKLNWASAVDACKAKGMELAEIKSDENSKVLLKFLNNFFHVHRYDPRAYVGISREANSEIYKTVSNGNKVNFNLVVHETLMDYFGKTCLVADAFQSRAKFTVSLCDQEHQFICEKIEGSASGIM